MPKESGEGRESALQSGWTVEARTEPAVPAQPVIETPIAPESADAAGTEEAGTDAEARPAQLSSLTVVMLGLTGGIYMLYAWVWMSWAKYYSAVNEAVVAGSGSIGGALQQIVFWIAPAAPVLWFVAALLLHRQETKKLSIALVIGLIVLLPLPMIFANGAAL